MYDKNMRFLNAELERIIACDSCVIREENCQYCNIEQEIEFAL